MAEPAQKVYDDDNSEQPVTGPDLRALEGGGQTTPPRRGHLKPGPDSNEEERPGSSGNGEDAGRQKEKSLSREGLASAEGQSQPDTAGQDRLGRGYTGSRDGPDEQTGNKNAKGTLAAWGKKMLKKKWLWGGIGLGAGGGLLTIVAVIFFLGLFKIPDFAQHITAYQFAKVTRQMTQNTDKVMAEKIAIDSVDNSSWAKIKRLYTTPRGKARNLWSKLDRFRPNKIIDNFDTNNTFKFEYKNGGILRGPQIAGIRLNNETVLVRNAGFFKNFIPGVKFANNVRFARDIAPYLDEALKSNDIGPVIRWRVAAAIRRELGISLVAWKVGEYTNKDDAKARLQQARDMEKAIAEESIEKSKTASLNKAAEDGNKQLEQDLKNDKKLGAILDNKGFDPNVVNTVNKILGDNGFLATALSFISPVYAVATPICLVYDGSLVRSGGTMDAQNAELQRTYYYIASAADQQKNGYNADGQAVGALNDRLGDIPKSNAEIRASGGHVNTSGYPSAEASPSGDYSIADVLPGVAGDFANAVADNACPIFTNTWANIGLGVANVAWCFLPWIGPETCLGEQAAKEGAQTIVGRLAGRIAEKFISDQAAGKATALGGIVTDGVKGLGKTIVGVGAATILAKMIVYSNMNSIHNGLQSNIDLSNDADAGGNLAGNNVENRQFYGRPLTDAEAAQSHAADRKMLGQIESSKSAFQRYADLKNPDSLLSKVAMMAAGNFSLSSASSFINLIGDMLAPLQSLANMFGALNNNVVLAGTASTSVNSDYGNVQMGYSAKEEALMQKDPSYGVLENQKALDDSGKEAEIDHLYGVCFDGSKSIGDMLADGYIQRDNNGDVIPNKGRCAPHNLSFHNPKYGDLVFRWRVAHNYGSTVDQLLDAQTVASASVLAPTTAPGSTPTGNFQQLAQQIVQLHNQGKIVYALDTSQLDSNFKRMASGQKPVTDNGHQPTPDTRILQAIVYLAQQGTVQLNSYVDGASHTSPGNPHYEGKAIDIGAFDGKTLGSGNVAETKKVEGIVAQVLPAHSRFGADFYSDTSWTAPITLDNKTFYTGNDSGGHLHMDTLNVN